jgi:hypothetical protein
MEEDIDTSDASITEDVILADAIPAFANRVSLCDICDETVVQNILGSHREELECVIDDRPNFDHYGNRDTFKHAVAGNCAVCTTTYKALKARNPTILSDAAPFRTFATLLAGSSFQIQCLDNATHDNLHKTFKTSKENFSASFAFRLCLLPDPDEYL